MNIYQSLFDILHTHIYGGATLTADMNLVCTLMSTIGSVFVFAIPFMVCFWILKTICGR